MVEEIQRLIKEEYSTPGSRLPKESELADRFQVSRIVVREAMKVLEDRGMVEVRAGRGTMTVAPSPESVKESLLRFFGDQPVPTLEEMESLLELGRCWRRRAPLWQRCAGPRKIIQEIEAALQEMSREDADLQETIDADLRFHRRRDACGP